MSVTKNDGFRALVVDDDSAMRDSLSVLLEAAGWQVDLLDNAAKVEKQLITFQPDVVVSDVRMPGMSGLELLQSLSGVTDPPVVLISAHGDIPMAVQAMQDGAYSFLEKPFEPRRLLAALRNAAERHRLNRSAERLKERLASLADLDRVLLGDTPVIRELRASVMDLSDSDASVMLLGETGTGKELVARALHDLSGRSAGPFIAVNCAAIPMDQFEASMFGTADGKPGVLAAADGGTLMLDEIGAAPLEAQAKLLRAIETREFTRLGAVIPETSNFRVVSASNDQLEDAVAQGKFREDLLFRLNTVVLTQPALRDRPDDIPLLYAHYIAQYAALYEISPPEPTAEDLAALLSHEWPGNVRELRNVAERRVLAARRGRGSAAEAISIAPETGDIPVTLRESVAAFERQMIAQAIKSHDGRMDAVAEALGIGRRTLNEKIVKLGLNKSELL